MRETHQMMRIMFVVAASALTVTAALAQSDVLEQRTALMRAQGQAVYRDMGRMMKGDDPYDQAKVDAAFAKLKDTTSRFLGVFPADRKGGVDPKAEYFASDKVWDNRADFEARAAKFAEDVNELGPKAKSVEGFKEVYPELRKNCDGCHEIYRVKKS